MRRPARRFVLLAALIAAASAQAQSETAAVPGALTVEQAKAQYLGRWMIFAGSFGSWPEEFTDVRAGSDGNLELDVTSYFDPSKPAKRVAQLSPDGLTFFYDRPQCKGMAHVDEQGRFHMTFKPTNAEGTKLKGVMMGRSCTNSNPAELRKQ